MLYVFFWVIPRRLNFICRRFGTLRLFHLHRQVGARAYLPMKMEQSVPKRRHINFRRRGITQKRTYLPMKMEQTECSETSAYTIQTPGNHPKESIQQL